MPISDDSLAAIKAVLRIDGDKAKIAPSLVSGLISDLEDAYADIRRLTENHEATEKTFGPWEETLYVVERMLAGEWRSGLQSFATNAEAVEKAKRLRELMPDTPLRIIKERITLTRTILQSVGD